MTKDKLFTIEGHKFLVTLHLMEDKISIITDDCLEEIMVYPGVYYKEDFEHLGYIVESTGTYNRLTEKSLFNHLKSTMGYTQKKYFTSFCFGLN